MSELSDAEDDNSGECGCGTKVSGETRDSQVDHIAGDASSVVESPDLENPAIESPRPALESVNLPMAMESPALPLERSIIPEQNLPLTVDIEEIIPQIISYCKKKRYWQ